MKEKNKCNIDFTLWPKNEKTPAIFKATVLFDRINNYPSLEKHIECVLHFLWILSTQNNESLTIREGALRAALSEFILLTEAFDKLKESGWIIYDKNIPIYHLLKMLRNTQLHLVNLQLNSQTVNLKYQNESFQDSFGAFDLTIYITQEITLAHLTEWKHLDRYYISDLEKIIEWYNLEQKKFGTHNLIYIGLRQFIETELLN